MTKSPSLVLLAIGAVAACSDASSDDRRAWSCDDARIANGTRFECTGTVRSAFGAPTYTCGSASTSVDCPPEAAAAPGTYDANPPPSGGTSDNQGVFDDTGAGGASPPATGSGASASGGASSGEIPTPASSDGRDVEWTCQASGDDRHCTKAPKCDAGYHADAKNECSSGSGPSGGTGGATPPVGGDGTSVTGPRFPGAGGGAGGLPGATLECYYPAGGAAAPGMPAATVEYLLEAIQGPQSVHVRVTFNPDFVDNTYGANAVGWARGHTFKDLVGSDHVELSMLDKTNVEKLHFKVDYISQTTAASSGYATLGVSGGDGKMILGSASAITKASTSLDRNMNERGYKTYVVDSPPTDAKYTPSPAAPLWDYRVVYEVWVDDAAFGAAAFGSVTLTYVHASPSKESTNTITVVKQPCPPDWHE